jgi:hypothetical protein
MCRSIPRTLLALAADSSVYGFGELSGLGIDEGEEVESTYVPRRISGLTCVH